MAELKCNNTLVFFVNGRKICSQYVNPDDSLLHFLRTCLKLGGTKYACGEGACGACTVMVSRYDRNNKKIIHRTENACVTPVASVHGCAVTTVEGVGSMHTRPHPVQIHLARYHGTQCGFCSPGMVMTMYTLLRNNPHPTGQQIEQALAGNLCRCTGYRPILAGFKHLGQRCPMGDQCCKLLKNDDNQAKVEGSTEEKSPLNIPRSTEKCSEDRELIFPPELQMNAAHGEECLCLRGESTTWYRPTTVQQLQEILRKNSGATVIAGATTWVFQQNLKQEVMKIYVNISQVNELREICASEAGIELGACVTLTELMEYIHSIQATLAESKSTYLRTVLHMLQQFDSPQIRNVSTVGGAVMCASPTSDVIVVLLATRGTITTYNLTDGESQTVTILPEFFLGKRTSLGLSHVVKSVSIPLLDSEQVTSKLNQTYCEFFKEDSIPKINSCMVARLDGGDNKIEDVNLAFGGMSDRPVLATKTMAELKNMSWTASSLEVGCRCLAEELLLPAGTPGGAETYRTTLAISWFHKFFLSVANKHGITLVLNMPRAIFTACQTGDSEKHGSQYFEGRLQCSVHPELCDHKGDALRKPIPHVSSLRHATGEAVYLDDMPKYADELELAPVISSRSHAVIVSVDVSEALALPGVHSYIDHKDVPVNNTPADPDMPIFADGKVMYQGQIIGAILADTREKAQRAAKLVHVEYEDLEPVITIEDAIAAQSMFPESRSFSEGDVESAFSSCDVTVTGKLRLPGQQHFYMETNAALAVPSTEDSSLDLHIGCQDLTPLQDILCSALGTPANKLRCKSKRIGGAFGGKGFQAFYVGLTTTVAANKVKRPVRCVFSRHDDMQILGGRHPMLVHYKIGSDKDGHVKAIDLDCYVNAGYALESSALLVTRAYMNLIPHYRVHHLRTRWYLCKTNIHSSTAMRGFGCPQASFITETCLHHLAHQLDVPTSQLRDMNFTQIGDTTVHGTKMENYDLVGCCQELSETARVLDRETSVREYNKYSPYTKRGIAIVPTIFPSGLPFKFANQGSALVNIYKDGSIYISHGGVEMGQGIDTKCIQTASHVLCVDIDLININNASTEVVPNTSPTGGSTASDLFASAVKDACEQLAKRLQPIRDNLPDSSWQKLVEEAYMNRIHLSAAGFFRFEGVIFDEDTLHGPYTPYFTYGAACSEVEVDCLTGHHKVLQTDIVMDVGRSLNPAVDIGQIEGAFLQGYGLFMKESIKFSPSGHLISKGPSFYHIPKVNEIPSKLNVTLRNERENPYGVLSSKVIGEPPLFLAASVYFAVKNAVMAARKDNGITEYFQLDCPATPQRVRLACEDKLVAMAINQRKENITEAENNKKCWCIDL